MFVPFFVFGAWNGNPYSQGETLNPECAPTDENCTVSVLAGSSQWGSVESGITFLSGNVGIGTDNPLAMLHIYGEGSGEFVGGYPALLNIHTYDDSPWGITFQNDSAGTDKEIGMYLDDNGVFHIGGENNFDSFTVSYNGLVGIGIEGDSSSALIIKQRGSFQNEVEQIVNGNFNAEDYAWEMSGGWYYEDGRAYFNSNYIAGVNYFEVIDGGSGYNLDDEVIIDGGNGEAVFVVSRILGEVTGVHIVNPGINYEVGDILTFESGNEDLRGGTSG